MLLAYAWENLLFLMHVERWCILADQKNFFFYLIPQVSLVPGFFFPNLKFLIFFLGGNLQDLYESPTQMCWKHILSIAKDLASAIQYMHRKFSLN